MANGLRGLGLVPGDRVAVCMPMVPEILSILYGCFKAGLIVVPIFAGFGPGAIATRLEDSGARVLFTADSLYRRGKRIPLREKMPATDGAYYCRAAMSRSLRTIRPRKPRRLTLDAEARAFILYTSGTTGKPEGRGSHACRLPGADGQGDLAGLRPSGRGPLLLALATSAG